MRISYNWLKTYFPEAPEINETVDLLTNTGLEVEGAEEFESIPGQLKGLVVGEILEVWDHPNADRLKLTRIKPGNGEELQIVCGAPNVAQGQKVIVALEGSTLHPLKGDPFVIRKGKIRGELSQGMICAEDEIGLGKGHDGIMVLREDAIPGTPAGAYFDIYSDTSIEIGLTPNRTDAMSHFGVARDLRAACYFRDGAEPAILTDLILPDISGFTGTEGSTAIPVIVESTDACLRYAGTIIEGITVATSPEWLQNKLKAIGLKPVNNVVDITNFVMHETGQPLHAFDADKITGNKVIVRMAHEGEHFTTLDDKKRELDASDLMICDAEKPMCIAGVFGGTESGITDGSTRVFLESAVFDPVYIRQTARRHQLNTDASYRFERGVDPEMTLYALKRAALLISELAGGIISDTFSDHYPSALLPAQISVDLARMTSLMGIDIPKERIIEILKSLDFTVHASAGNTLEVTAPLYRRDVTRMADVAEEVLRIFGYNSVEVPSRLHSALAGIPKPNLEAIHQRIADLLVSRGFTEIMNNSLSRLAYQELSKEAALSASAAVKILNPLSSDLGQMRQSMLYQGLETISRNVNHKQSDLRLFEFGYTYHLDGGNVVERPHLSILITGKAMPENWNNGGGESSFSDLHGVISAVFQALGLDRKHKYEDSISDHLSDGIDIFRKKDLLVSAGIVKPSLLVEFDIKQTVFYADFNWEILMKLRSNHQVSFKSLPKYPAVRRDLSVLLDQSVRFSEIQKSAGQAEQKLLTEVGLFDVYEGKNLPEGKKSYAVSFTLQDESSTLTEKKIDAAMQRILKALQNDLGAELRS